ncbi:Syntaxin-42 [Galdieria sulphuraria]|nr:Syntaxin-42 [Galdieria sulphuraria]
MTTRDRTAIFKRYREESVVAKRKRSGNDGIQTIGNQSLSGNHKELAPFLNKGSIQTDSHTVFLPPQWLDWYEELSNSVDSVTHQLAQLESLQQNHLLPGFEERSDEESQISELSRNITLLLQRSQERIRLLAPSSSEPNISSEEKLLRTNAQKYFASKLQELSLSFRRNQKEYLRKLQGQNALVEESTDENPLSTSLELEEYDPGFTQEQVMLLENSDQVASERQREIMKIASSINDLATIVKDIASLVIDQGTLLDRIDYNVEEIEVSTEGAVKELEKAKRSQKKGLAFFLILILSIGCGIMFLLLLAKIFR